LSSSQLVNMGKKQHSKDRMFITATEWQRDFGGHKSSGPGVAAARLPLDCCALSFTPWSMPVMTPSGGVYELENLVPFVQRFKKDPITGDALNLAQITKLHFSRNAEGKLQCPMLFKPFSDSTHVVALRTTGNVYSYEAIDTLCLKPKALMDLLDNSPFKKEDIITLQSVEMARNPSNFLHVKDENIAKSVQEMRTGGGAGSAAAASASAAAASSVAKPASSSSTGPARALYSSGAVSGSFTSTSMTPATLNERTILTSEQIQQQHYAHIRKTKQKGYVRLHTNLGNINIELHCDLVPKTCHNFLELCERGYYKDTTFHRLIPGFMIQGGDPTGTGRGGEGAFKKKFEDEFHPLLKHDTRGILSMANSGKDTNGSQFFITFDACNHLNNKHSVFGRVVGGSEVLDAMEKVDTVTYQSKAPGSKPKDSPLREIRITAVTVYTNPFKDKFVPVDELTGKKEGETEEKEVKADEVETGAWFSNPTAASVAAGMKTAQPGSTFKYLNLPEPTNKATNNPASKKRKAGEGAAPQAHPALRAAATVTSSASPSSSTTKSSSTTADDDAREFEVARRRQQTAALLAQRNALASKSSSYGNWSNF